MSEPVLRVDDLRVRFHTDDGVVRAVDGVSYSLQRGECLAIVGESGSGKTVTQLAVMGLLPSPPARIESGRAELEGTDLLSLPREQLRRLRGKRIGMIFQDPMTSLNPFLTVERQLTEVLEVHDGLSRREARQRAEAMLESVGIPEPARRMKQHPHELSGGMRQRVMIAMALLCRPAVLVADEPTTALDVTIQAQILELIDGLREETGTGVVMITHDLGVVAAVAHRVCVMYAGRIVESASVEQLYAAPQHPYTKGLLASVPRLVGDEVAALEAIPGQPPDLANLPAGCAYRERCAFAQARCAEATPPLEPQTEGHAVRCFGVSEGFVS